MAEWVWQGCHTLLQIAEVQLSAKIEIKFGIDVLHSYSRCCIPTKKGVAFIGMQHLFWWKYNY